MASYEWVNLCAQVLHLGYFRFLPLCLYFCTSTANSLSMFPMGSENAPQVDKWSVKIGALDQPMHVRISSICQHILIYLW